MKVLAAHRAGLTTVILPKRNERDLDDIPDEVRQAMQFVLVDHIDEAMAAAFEQGPGGHLDMHCGSIDCFTNDASLVHANCQSTGPGVVR